MMRCILFILVFGFLLSCAPAKPEQADQPEQPTQEIQSPTVENPKDVIEYLGVPGPFQFQDQEFKLIWSSHPTEAYYKQEYGSEKADPNHYQEMIMLELATGQVNTRDLADDKGNYIKNRKGSDPFAEYEFSQISKTGDITLDFMLSEGSGENTIVEWNVYRYTNPVGLAGVELFAFSKRAYGSQAEAFAKDIRANRKQYIAEFIKLPMPAIHLSN